MGAKVGGGIERGGEPASEGRSMDAKIFCCRVGGAIIRRRNGACISGLEKFWGGVEIKVIKKSSGEDQEEVRRQNGGLKQNIWGTRTRSQ